MNMDEVKILLVRRRKKIAEALRKGLMEQQYHVEVAYDGLIGKKMVETYKFDLVILDINLPGMNGYELCKEIRKQDERIPVVMLTALQRYRR